MLHLAGYGLKIEDLKNFRQLNSLTPGHPEYGHTKGVDATTGPLGQGLTMGVGMALAESHLAEKFNTKDFKVIDHFTYILCGDGDLQEGVAQEAISFAGRYKLNKIILLHDSNDIQLDAPVNVAQIKNGEDLSEINKAIELAKKSDKPTYIEVKTIIGIGATKQDLNKKVEQATRVSSQQIFNELSTQIPAIFGGSADLSESTKIKGLDGNYDFNFKKGRNVMYGVREFAMAGINNGIALHKGLLPVASGFFVFADYLKPALRLSSLMNLQSLYIFTHDSIAVGEDGPTHQPIEQLAMIRSIPNISVYRPCDFAETAASYMLAIQDKKTPSVLVLTRQNLVELEHKDVLNDVKKGAYIIKDNSKAVVSLIATGSEVKLALDVANLLEKDNIQVKVISMPNQNLFDKQDQNYKDQIIDKETKRFSIELSSTFG
ncbi:hypothetical protein FQR65_LT17181 [Abscondita terminalis]|nr:hypothetical protein FQR65_LT17181 [Abscondita terminalis]